MNVTLVKAGPVDICTSAPPSKSYTHRALLAAGLGAGASRIRAPLRSGDTLVTASALERLGVPVSWDPLEGIAIAGRAGKLCCREGVILDMGDSGTSLRLLTSAALLCGAPVTVTGSARMKERPVGGLVSALNRLGGEIRYLGEEGFPPLLVRGRLRGGRVRVESRVSSQFASSLLLSAPYAEYGIDLVLAPGAVSRSYLDVTIDVMEAFGVRVDREGSGRFMVEPGQGYGGREYRIEGDYSSASYLFAIAATCGGRARVSSLPPGSVQGDRRFLDALEAMGCRVTHKGDCVTLESGGVLDGIEMDLSDSPDMVQTLCMVAATARSRSRFSGIAHLRYKESDRIHAIVSTLRALGGDVHIGGDGTMEIGPAPLHGGTIDPAGDHRTAMSGAVLGLAIGGVTILDAGCVDKSFPGFWEILHSEGLL